ncbi:hypothetical protein Ocin01_06710 [Orchesella cincta]|uniref:Uncharacterized protein n=1 Tax=Orchesella cincta TaxID=48709 RepID=A0A1D2N3Z3_ORCCI|nr:hypothetical protein Ocin01_06710 [Orchesella cincta]
MRSAILFTLAIFSLSIHLTSGGIFRRYVRKHRPEGGHRLPQHMIMSRSRMGPPLVERQFRIRQRPWNMFVRRPRAPAWPPILYHYPMQYSPMFQTTQPRMNMRASRRFRFQEQSSRVPQFHHQPLGARHHHPIGISTTTRLPTTSAVQWRPLDYGNPIDRDPTYDYAPPAVERVRFVTEVRGRQPTARANTGMIGMYSRPTPVIVPAPWKRDPNVLARHPILSQQHLHLPQQHQQQLQQHHHHHHQQQQQQHSHAQQHHLPPPPPPRGAFPLWKILSHKQRPRRPQRPVRPQPPRFIGQDPKHPLYHHQVYQEEAEVHPHIPNIVYFQPTDVVPTKNQGKTKVNPKPGLKPGSVASADLYSAEVASASEFKPIHPTRTSSANKSAQSSGNKGYKFTVVGYSGPVATTPMSPVASAPYTTTLRPPTVFYAVKTTPETLSTTHNSVVKPLEPTESLDAQEEAEAASELRPVHVLPNNIPEVEDGREQGAMEDVDFDNTDDSDSQAVPVVPNSFNVFESLLSSFEKEFGNVDEEQDNEEEILEVKDNHHHQRIPVFEPVEEASSGGEVAEPTTPTSARNNNFETSTSISMSVGVSSSSTTSKKSSNTKKEEDEKSVAADDDTDGYFGIRLAPSTTSSTTTSTTTTTTERPVTTSRTTESTTTTTSTTAKSTSTAYPRLPTMPTYKRKPTPVYARKSSKAGGLLSKYSSSSSSISKEVSATGGGVPNGSGEVVIITAGRSKVKEYKPQVIANQTHLLAFDKVVADGEGVKESPIIGAESNASPSSTSTTKSPLEEFDAMQLLHSWLNKA